MSTNHVDAKRAQHRARSARQIRHPRTACVGCGIETRAGDRMCPKCRLVELARQDDVPLTGGAWVPNGRGVSVWVAT